MVDQRYDALFADLREQCRVGTGADAAVVGLLETLAGHLGAEHAWIWRLDREGTLLDRAPFAEMAAASYPHRPFGYESGDPALVTQSVDRIVAAEFRPVRFVAPPPNAPMARSPSRFLAIRLEHLLETGWALVLERSPERTPWETEDGALLDRCADALALALNGRVLRKQVNEQASYLRSILDSGDLGVLLIDRRIGRGWVLLTNERCRHLLGIGADTPDLAGQPAARLVETLRSMSQDWTRDEPLVRRLVDEVDTEVEGHIALGSSIARTLHVRAIPARAESGHVFGRALLLRDISRDEEMEQQLLHSHKMQSIGTLAGGIAHDFNNLLTTVLGYAELLKRDLDAEHPGRARVAHIERAARRAADLTTGLLAFSRRSATNMRVLDLSRLVEDTLEMIRPSLPPTVELTVRVDPALPPVEGDESHLQQVLINVVLNARDAVGSKGHIHISTRAGTDAQAAPDEDRGQYVVLEVEDDGVGIPRENLTRIFEPFYTTKEVGEGTGLGLSMVYGIVKQHNGFIEVTSAAGAGARFSIFLPLTLKNVAAPAARERAPAPNAPPAAPPRALRILAVDDEVDLREFCREVLAPSCREIHLAANGAEAVEMVRRHGADIDLVILDLTMPRTCGTECFREMRRIVPGLRVIITSGYNSMGAAVANLLREGAAGFLPKPFDMGALLRAVEEAMNAAAPAPAQADVVAEP